MKIEDEISAMFPFQRETIARATLAGCRFERCEGQRRIGGGPGGMKRGWVAHVMYEAFLPDGTYVNPPTSGDGFGDVYEAAVACLTFLDHIDGSSFSVAADGSFVLRPENEQ